MGKEFVDYKKNASMNTNGKTVIKRTYGTKSSDGYWKERPCGNFFTGNDEDLLKS